MFKVGDVVVCIDNSNRLNNYFREDELSIGKEYVVIHGYQELGDKSYSYNYELISIISNFGGERVHLANRFVSLSEYRKMKIKKLCSKLEI